MLSIELRGFETAVVCLFLTYMYHSNFDCFCLQCIDKFSDAIRTLKTDLSLNKNICNKRIKKAEYLNILFNGLFKIK